MSEARRTLYAANTELAGAARVVDESRVVLDAAILALEGIARANQLGANAAAEISRFGLTGLINIREITFDVSLSAANSGRFAGSVRATILNRDMSVMINIDLNDVIGMARQLADHVGSGFSSLF